jgi:hypothetical protein
VARTGQEWRADAGLRRDTAADTSGLSTLQARAVLELTHAGMQAPFQFSERTGAHCNLSIVRATAHTACCCRCGCGSAGTGTSNRSSDAWLCMHPHCAPRLTANPTKSLRRQHLQRDGDAGGGRGGVGGAAAQGRDQVRVRPGQQPTPGPLPVDDLRQEEEVDPACDVGSGFWNWVFRGQGSSACPAGHWLHCTCGSCVQKHAAGWFMQHGRT